MKGSDVFNVQLEPVDSTSCSAANSSSALRIVFEDLQAAAAPERSQLEHLMNRTFFLMMKHKLFALAAEASVLLLLGRFQKSMMIGHDR